MVVPALLALVARGLDISVLVGWAFALAASTFCPLLLLGIWWDRLTARGAACGLVVGAVGATAAIFTGLVGGAGAAPPKRCSPSRRCSACGWSSRRWRSCRCWTARAPRPAAIELLALHATEGLGLGLSEEEVEPARA